MNFSTLSFIFSRWAVRVRAVPPWGCWWREDLVWWVRQYVAWSKRREEPRREKSGYFCPLKMPTSCEKTSSYLKCIGRKKINTNALKCGLYRNKEETLAVFKKHRPTHVIHLAAMVGGLFKNMKCNLDFLVWRCCSKMCLHLHELLLDSAADVSISCRETTSTSTIMCCRRHMKWA